MAPAGREEASAIFDGAGEAAMAVVIDTAFPLSALLFVLLTTLVVRRRGTRLAAGGGGGNGEDGDDEDEGDEGSPFIPAACDEPGASRGKLFTAAALVGCALACAALAAAAYFTLGPGVARRPGCLTDDEALLRGAYDIPGLGGLGLPPAGTPRLPINTSSSQAQRLFDQGLLLAFGFNHAEARRNLRAALRADPACVMCLWGLAHALGPYVNVPMALEESLAAREAVDEALELLARQGRDLATREVALVRAMDLRFARDAAAFEAGGREGQHARDRAFSEALCAAADTEPDFLDLQALCAESLMTLYPWDYFHERPTNAFRPPLSSLRPEGAQALERVERVLARDPSHPLALHLVVHLTESSATPERGIPHAEALAAGRAGAGNSHLVHMAAHAFLNAGNYPAVVDANARARAVDVAYAERCLEPYFPGHQRAQLSAGAMQAAQPSAALGAAANASDVDGELYGRHMQALVPLATPLARARFGQWEPLLAEMEAEAAEVRALASAPFAASLWSYGRALALLHTGRAAEAREEAARLASLAEAVPPPELPSGHVFDASHRKLAFIARDTVRAALALVDDGDPAAAAKLLESATAVEDGLPYMEPEHWYLPVRLCLGAARLEAGDAEGALHDFEEDLRQHRNSGWALTGKAAALRVLGREEDVRGTEALLHLAWSAAEVRPKGACCELGLC